MGARDDVVVAVHAVMESSNTINVMNLVDGDSLVRDSLMNDLLGDFNSF